MITIKSLQQTFFFLEIEGQLISLKPNEQIIIDETKLNARQLKEIINLTVEDKIELLDYSLNQLKDKLEELSPYYRKAEIDTALESKAAEDHLHSIVTNTENGFMSSSDKTKLDTIEANATVNETDDFLRDRATHTGTQLAATVSDFAPSVRSTALEGLSTATAAPVTATDTVLTGVGKLQAQVDLKLDAAAYNDRFLGLFATYFDLVAAHPTASAGDYAQVDWGIGTDVIIYAWDVSDAYWAAIGVSTISTTDDVPEGSSNLYFTSQRVRDTTLTGLSTATATPVTADDTVLAAAGKLQAQATDIEAKLATIQEGATANSNDAALRDRATHTGTQAANTITGLATVATSGSYNDLSDKPTISTDAATLNGQNGVYYLSRANHTGTQLAATVSDFAPSVRSTALSGLSTATATPVVPTDTVLAAAGKLQRQATDNAALLPTFFDTAWYKTGMYYDAVYPYYTTISPTTGEVGTLYFNKRKILDNATFNELSVNVTTAAASSTVFYGIYASDASGLPSTLLASGSASGDTTGVKSTAITLALTKGQVVWDAVLETGAAPSLTALQPIFKGGTGSPTANGTVLLTRSSQTSLPADASVDGSFGLLTTTRIIRIALRAA